MNVKQHNLRFQAAQVLMALSLSSAPAVCFAQPANPNLATPVQAGNVDAAVYAEWENGEERTIAGSRDKSPDWVLWNDRTGVGLNGIKFGDSRRVGERYLRLGFKSAIPVGSVLVRGGGRLSVLKADAPYPGVLQDDTQWIPAQRLVNGIPSEAEVGPQELAVWVLPAGTNTRALRFSHTAQAADNGYAGYLGALFVMEERTANLAPLATVVTGSNNKQAALLNNARYEPDAWVNDAVEGAPVISAETPQNVVLFWPEPVKLSGLVGLWTGFRSMEVQAYTGPQDRHPRDAADTDWKNIRSFEGLKHGYASQLYPNRLDFGQEVTTRAIRLRVTSTAEENHPHLVGRSKNGRCVWLSEVMALQTLDRSPLQTVSFKTVPAQSQPPIPIRFKLDKPGHVTLVIEDASGKRVRNLIAATPFPAGDNVAWWDGTDDLGRDVDAARHGLYKIPSQFVQPGTYKVRGIVRDAIDLRYEFTAYSSGEPPWPLPDHTGAWLSNHSPAQAALFVPGPKSPSGKDVVMLGSYVSEGRDGVAWVDLDGRKLGGKTWIGGIWTGAAYLTRDGGTPANDKVYAYSGAAWDGQLRLMALGMDGNDKPVLSKPYKTPGDGRVDPKKNPIVNGIAAYDGQMVVSLGKAGQLVFVDLKTGEVAGTLSLADPRGLVFDASGRLLVLSGNTLVRFGKATGLGQFPAPVTVISTGLENPVALTLDEAGRIYISDQGKSHQVKVFGVDGKFVRAIGKAGVPVVGPYDPLHMNHPHGLAVDPRGQIWVTEHDYLPKRVSVWSQDGKLLRAFYGPGKYGGGGVIDSSDKSRFYYADEHIGSMEFKLDWEKGTSTLTNVLFRENEETPLPKRSGAPETAFYHNGRRYFTNAFNSSPTSGAGVAMIFQESGGVAKPIAAAGRANDWAVLKGEDFRSAWPNGVDLNGDLWKNNGQNQAFFIWSDANGDSKPQPLEVTWRTGIGSGVTLMPDLSFVVSRVGQKTLQYAPAGFSTAGVPTYDITKPKVVADGVQAPGSSGGDQVLVGENGWTVMTLGIKPFHAHSITGLKDGVPQWSYPNLWPGLHASHEAAKPDRPGQVIGVTRLLGGFVKPSAAGQVWGVNGNMGNMYLFTSDGLFVAQLFEDGRQGKLWQMPRAERNMKLENVTLRDENFWPTLTQTQDGQVYVVDGVNMAIVRVDGLKSLRRLPDSTIQVTADDLSKAQAHLVAAEAERQAAEGRGVLEVALRDQSPTVDGKLSDWAGASWVDIDKSGAGANFDSTSKPYDISGAVTIAGDRLFAAFRTADAKLLRNSGEMPTAPFKTGGALDLMLGTDDKADPKRSKPVQGDIRLLITEIKGKPKALLYRAVVPGTTNPVPFASPWRTITLDQVDDVSDQVQLVGDGGNYEISIPLGVLGLKPQPGGTLRGDIGVLRGDGSSTTARTYWSNKATGITADVPSEAQLTPQLWGPWQFKAAP